MKLCFSLLGMPVLLKKSLHLFISNLNLVFLISTRYNVGLIISIVIWKEIRIPSSDLLFQLVFVIKFRASHTLLNAIKILMKSEKDQRKIPWVCGLILPLVRFYGLGISGINDNNSEANKSWQIYFWLNQKEILKSGHS